MHTASLLAAALLACGSHVHAKVDDSITLVNPIIPAGVQLLFVEGLGRVDILTNQSKVDMSIVRTLRCDTEDDPNCRAGVVQLKVQAATSKVVRDLSNTPGVLGVSTSGQSLSVLSEYNETLQKSIFTGYRSQVGLSAVIPTSQIGAILDKMLNLGVNTINSVDFYVSNDQLRAAQEKALALATKNALDQAKAVLEPIKKSILETRQVVIPYDYSPYESRPADIMDDSVIDLNAADPIQGGVKTVGYRVKLKVKYGQLGKN
eukprot:comp25111_c0_seq1/m.46956 comp25111_c0_seq1/g.46956  ORF comp25111_c0_seq1/g.46956 comp25111_c0_seq1/m.46956 type:complete len:261 (-) comp25111_c0_seq1:458-1240(-)